MIGVMVFGKFMATSMRSCERRWHLLLPQRVKSRPYDKETMMDATPRTKESTQTIV